MIKIDIFKENHRFSEQTPHPDPRSVVGAANLAAGRRRKQPREQNRLPAVCELVVLAEQEVKMANLNVFYQGPDLNGALGYCYFDNTFSAGPFQLGGERMSASPSAVAWAGGLNVFHQGPGDNGQLWYARAASIVPTVWSEEDKVVPNLALTDSPSAVVYNGLLYVFHQGGGNEERYLVFDGTNWGGDTLIPNVDMSGSPSAVLWAGGISVFHQGNGDDQSLWYSYFDGTNWYGDTLVPNLGLSGSPSTVVYNGNLYVFHQGEGNDGQLWYSSNDGTNWTADTPVQNLGMSGSPSAVLWAGGISVFHAGGANGSLWYSYFDGTNWYPDTQVQNAAGEFVTMSESPSAVVF